VNITPDEVILSIGVAAVCVGAISNAVLQLPFVQDRPGLKRIANGAKLAAGRIAQALPPGTSAAQVETMIANEAVGMGTKYADSIKVAKTDQAVVKDMIAGELGHLVPAGHIVASVPPAAQDAVTSFIADVKAALVAQPTLAAGTSASAPTPAPA